MARIGDRGEGVSAGRRGFLRMAGAGLLIPAWLAACNKAGGEAGAEGGQAKAEAPSGVVEGDGKQKAKDGEAEANDAALYNKGIAMEQGAVNAYAAAAKLPFIASDPAVLAVAAHFMADHTAHRDALARWCEQLGGKPIDPATAPTPEIPAEILDGSKPDDERKLAVLRFARELEKQAADAYFKMVTANMLTELGRRCAAELLPVEAQHVAVYDFVLKADKVTSAALFSEQM